MKLIRVGKRLTVVCYLHVDAALFQGVFEVRLPLHGGLEQLEGRILSPVKGFTDGQSLEEV